VDLLDEGQTTDGVRLHELVTQMSAHSAHQIDILSTAPPHEILGVARILASEARPNDDGAAFDAKLVKLGPTCVEAHLGRNGFVRAGGMTPTASPRIAQSQPRTPTPFRGDAGVQLAHAAARGGDPDAICERGHSCDAGRRRCCDHAGARGAHARSRPNDGDAGAACDSSRACPQSATSRSASSRERSRSRRSRRMSDDEMIEQLRTGVTPQQIMRLLDELATVAECRAREQPMGSRGPHLRHVRPQGSCCRA
jgi:hypothetical protein